MRLRASAFSKAGVFSKAAVLACILATPVIAAAQPEGEAPAEEVGQAEEAQAEEAVPTPSPALVEARERVGRGEELFEQENYDAALVEFLRAYEMLDGHPMQYFVLYNVGQCYEQLFRYGQAMEFYRRYLADGGAEAEDAAEVRAKIGVLSGLLGTLHIQVSSSDAEVELGTFQVWVDESLVGEDQTEVLVPGGNHVVEIRAEGFESARQEVQLPARSEQDLTFEIDPLAEEYEGLAPAFFWTSAGLAVVAAGVGAVFGVQALQRRSDVDDALARGDGTVDGSDKDEISRLALTADVFYATAALFTVGAIVLGVMTDWGEVSVGEPDDATEARFRISPAMSPEGAGLMLQGQF